MLKKIFGFFVLLFSFQQIVIAQNNTKPQILHRNSQMNLLISFSKEWESSIYAKCNTAKDLNYLTQNEKDVIWILNLIRLNPTLFLNSVLLNPLSPAYKDIKSRSSYLNSLIKDLKELEPNPLLFVPDSNLFVTAKCHAFSSGKTGYVGHNRKKNACYKDFYGECCSYGYKDPFDIVVSLLIDEDVPDLGHRHIMLSKKYTLIGVSTQPHSSYRINTVLDFK